MKIGKYSNLMITAIVWSFFLASQGYANQTFSSFTTGAIMFGVSGVLLLITAIVQKNVKSLLDVKGVLPYLILIGVICFCSNLSSFMGYKYGDPQTGTFLLKTDVFMVCLVSGIIYKEKFDKIDVLCGLSMFAGVLLILNIDFATMSFRTTDILFLLGALFTTINSFIVAHMLNKPDRQIPSHVVAFYNSWVSCALFSFMMVVSGDITSVATGLAQPDVLIALIVLALSQYGIFIVYYRALKELPVWVVKVALLLVPIITMVLSYFIYGTIPTAVSVLGGMLVLISGYGVLKNQQKKHQATASK